MNRPHHRQRSAAKRQAGVTLVELMVALVIGLVVSAAAVASLIVARNGFTSVDSTAQMRENARFTADLIQRLAVQAGFEDVASGRFSAVPPQGKAPAVQGYDDSLVDIAALPNGLTDGSRSAGCGGVSDTSCVNGSDVLVLRFWGTSRNGVADGSMINCAGVAEPEGADRSYSIFHVVRSAAGEPTLACTYLTAAGTWQTEGLIPGVEAFQVLYGVDNVTPNTAPPAGTAGTDSIPDRYLRASQMVVAGNAVETANNWRRVRSLRIGLVFRGAQNSAIDRAATAQTYNVLGEGYSVAADTLSQLPITADGRLRQQMVINVHLRNP